MEQRTAPHRRQEGSIDEAGTKVWMHAGEHRAINLRQVTDVAFEEGSVLAAHLHLTAHDASSPSGGAPATHASP